MVGSPYEMYKKEFNFLKSLKDNKCYYNTIYLSISKYFNLPLAALLIEKDKNGKPYLRDIKDIHISISHSKNILLYTISENKVGVDIEFIRPVKNFIDKIKNKAFHQEEIDYIYEDESDLDIKFFEVWTKKEAYLKYLGIGLNTKMYMINTLNITTISTYKFYNFIYSICSEKQS